MTTHKTDNDTTAQNHETPVEITPTWKRDFPYQAASEEEVTRREFARYLVLGASSMAVANVGLAAWTQLRSINVGEPRALIAIDSLAVADTHLFRYPTDAEPAILLRVSDDEVVAFSQKCTHLGCVVYFEAEEDRWLCPCHEGNFEAATGAVISGPPTRPLGKIDVEIRDDGMVWALGVVERS